ncbi:hypothetical protein NEIELOOT_01701 [Neisseria elongata subsp. glycolytica ATCC 29315]|uniref:Uncharacterized protein n=1 Tax=Neisseria elongata subsp. glycolytica ATCC 29315 TaxID=546263 RepID=D4DRK8_NEIEG|nr:hypothetical protein NEIELOOT_01701 [Neisseria elongata subsp. glycolytica ATCC 29315]
MIQSNIFQKAESEILPFFSIRRISLLRFIDFVFPLQLDGSF